MLNASGSRAQDSPEDCEEARQDSREGQGHEDGYEEGGGQVETRTLRKLSTPGTVQ